MPPGKDGAGGGASIGIIGGGNFQRKSASTEHRTGSAKATPGPPGISTFNQVRLRTRVTRRVLQCIMVSGATVVLFGVLLACLGYFVLSGTNPLRLIGPCVIGCGFMILLLAVEVCARGRHDFMGYDVQILTGVNEDNAMEWTAQEVEELKLALETFTVFPHGSLSSGSKHSSGSSKRSQPSNRLNNGTNLKGSTARKDPQRSFPSQRTNSPDGGRVSFMPSARRSKGIRTENEQHLVRGSQDPEAFDDLVLETYGVKLEDMSAEAYDQGSSRARVPNAQGRQGSGSRNPADRGAGQNQEPQRRVNIHVPTQNKTTLHPHQKHHQSQPPGDREGGG